MNSLNQQVNRALRRLMIQRFLGLLTWTCFAALLVCVGSGNC